MHKHADFLRDAWRDLVDCLLQLFRAQLLPEELLQADDFLAPSGFVELQPFVKQCAFIQIIHVQYAKYRFAYIRVQDTVVNNYTSIRIRVLNNLFVYAYFVK